MRSLLEILELRLRSASVIVVANVLAPTITEVTTASTGALEEYAGLLGAVVVMCIVGIMMVAVKLIGGKN